MHCVMLSSEKEKLYNGFIFKSSDPKQTDSEQHHKVQILYETEFEENDNDDDDDDPLLYCCTKEMHINK